MAASMRRVNFRNFSYFMKNFKPSHGPNSPVTCYLVRADSTARCSLNPSHVFSRSLGSTKSPPYQIKENRYAGEEEEELEYDIDESSLDKLRKEHRSALTSEHSADSKKFSDFPISEVLMKRLEILGYTEPFDVQSETLPHTLSDRDVITRAVTGSGKTLAFAIPIIHKLSKSATGERIPKNCPRAIVISPTRELCLQIYRCIEELDSRIRCLPVYGGESVQKQVNSIRRRGVDVICATPGRLKDHLEQGQLRLDNLEFLCLDEADHLLTPDFLVQIENVFKNSPAEKQTMLFSATLPPDIKHITRRYMKDPVYVDLTKGGQKKAPDSVKHLCMKVPAFQHAETLKEIIDEYNPTRCIIFNRTKVQVRSTASYLSRGGLPVQALHSDLSQRKRENILSAFRLGNVKILVATDVAARGLDIPEVDLVIQVEPPNTGIDFYTHRSGRTGRAGREGMAILLHSGQYEDRPILHQIQKMVNMEHKEPPNYEKLQSRIMNKFLLKLQNSVNKMDTSAANKIIDTMDLSDDQIRLLLAAAVTQINTPQSEPYKQREHSSGSYRYNNRNEQYNRGSYSRPQGGRRSVLRSVLDDGEW